MKENGGGGGDASLLTLSGEETKDIFNWNPKTKGLLVWGNGVHACEGENLSERERGGNKQVRSNKHAS